MKKLKFKTELIKIFSLIVFYLILIMPLPYLLESPGGIKDIGPKIEIENKKDNHNTFYETYIAVRKARIITLAYAYLNPYWVIVPISETPYHDYEIDRKMSKLALQLANQRATIVAYHYANYEYQIKNEDLHVVYITDDAKTEIKVGDVITEYSYDQFLDFLEEKKVGDQIEIKVARDDNIIITNSTLIKEGESAIIGLYLETSYDLNTNPIIKITNTEKESGASAGFMTALAIFDKLTDLKSINKTFAGTGTININGQIGEIEGVDLKLVAAADNEIDYFFVPNGLNYETAIITKEKHQLKIQIIGFDHFEEALQYLYPDYQPRGE